ncbi:hypothetical protein Q3Y58_04235 [Pseudovibrio sp. SPO723]|nr:hypothetical protein [Pseudovibrio sp. SPO723]
MGFQAAQQDAKDKVFRRIFASLLLALTFASCFGLALWANGADLPETFHGQARVIHKNAPAIVFEPDGLRLSSLLVEHGQLVEKGELLGKLASVFPVPLPKDPVPGKLSLLVEEANDLKKQQAYIAALQSGQSPNGAELREMSQAPFVKEGLSDLVFKLRKIDETRAHHLAEQRAARNLLKRLSDQLAEKRAEWNEKMPLVQRQLLPKTLVAPLTRSIATLQSQIQLARGAFNRHSQAITTSSEERAQVLEKYERGLANSLSAVEARISDLERAVETVKPAFVAPAFPAPIGGRIQVLRSPEDGHIPSTPVIAILPEQEELVVELEIAATTLAKHALQDGETVRLDLSAGSFTKDGGFVEGTLVLPDETFDDGSSEVFRSRRVFVKLDNETEADQLAAQSDAMWQPVKVHLGRGTILQEITPAFMMASVN